MNGSAQPSSQPMLIGRYAIYDPIASGGMATVHLGRLVGPAGFSRTVAVKRLHPQFARDPEVAQMLLDEARLAARVQHPNVVPTLDVVALGSEMLLVMEYVRGDALSRLVRAAVQTHVRMPPNVAVAIMLNALEGLHAAHEAIDERGLPLGLVHRDVSPQNIIVGVDGIARVLDFGIAKAEGRLVTTREGEVKGKVMYMCKEQLAGEHVSRAADIYAAGIILFETLTGIRMFAGENEVAAVSRIVAGDIRLPSQIDPALARFDAIVRRASSLLPHERHATAREMARELEAVCSPASAVTVGEWVQRLASERLDARARMVAEIERSSTRSAIVPIVEEPPQPTSGVVETARGLGPNLGPSPKATLPSLTGPMPMIQMSSPPPQKGGLGAIFGIVMALFIVLAGVGITAIVFSRRAAKPVAKATAIVEASPTPLAPPITSSAPDRAPETVEPAAASAPAASSVAPPAPVAPRAAKPKPKCDPPYTIDAKGHKHFLPECVGQ